MSLTVAIVGRPNVGKSTFFNRLVGKRLAIVHDLPGVTRDRREGVAKIGDLEFNVIDTAGLEEAEADSLPQRMREQTEQALKSADVACLLVDAREGITPMDQHFAEWLRKQKIPILLIANKCESKQGTDGLYECYALGLGDPIPVSAEHGDGMNLIYDALAPFAEEAADKLGENIKEQDNPPLHLAIVGRPNVGKSTLINKLLGEDRLLTGPEAGITRDAVTVSWNYKGQPIALIDTAGLRRKARIKEKLEYLSVGDTLRTIRFAHVVVLVLDSEVMLEKQDLTIARTVIEEGRALVIAMNKWDLIKDRKAAKQKLQDRLEKSLPQVRGIPIVPCSALTGKGLDKLLPAVLKIYGTWNRHVPTAPLNRWLETMIERHPPPLSQGRRVRLRYITQAKTRPPTFAIFTSRPAGIPDSYNRYLINSLRDNFNLSGVPIRLNLRKTDNPYVDS
ncbi:MAG: ribosome biogenesis GTPase Der [Rhodospirillales bacterium]|jgi:GTP-binding protein